MNNNGITLNEFKDILKYLVTNNKVLEDSGKKPLAIGIEGEAGLGKSAILQQVAEELGMSYTRINLAELEEVSDLTGFPIKEFETSDGNWIPADLVGSYCDPQKFTGNSRMSYATPEWLPDSKTEGGAIVCLDDYSRANSLFLQATMQLIQDGTYVSWKLPKYTTIVLSTNPDNGSYSVSSMDTAQRSRFINFPVKFSIDNWASWAENNQIDGRVINFALSYSHELFENPKHATFINPRSYTMFGNAIAGIKDWDKSESLGLILNISKGCFPDTDNTVGSLFTTFIANKLDKLVSPEDMLLGKWEVIMPKIKKCVYDDNGKYKPAIASVLHTRLLNYSQWYFEQKNSKSEVVYNRLMEILNNQDMLFDEDLIFNIIRTLCTKYKARTNKWILNNQIRSRIIA